MVSKSTYITCMENIYDKVTRHRLTIKECKELEHDLQTALQYEDISARDKDNFLYHQQHIVEYYAINKERINRAIIGQKAQILVCKNRISELEKQLV